MIINVKINTEASQEFRVGFWLVGVPFEKPYEKFTVVVYNKTTSQVRRMGELEGDNFETVIGQLKEYIIETFSPISTEVSFSKEFDDFSDDELLHISLNLTIRK